MKNKLSVSLITAALGLSSLAASAQNNPQFSLGKQPVLNSAKSHPTITKTDVTKNASSNVKKVVSNQSTLNQAKSASKAKGIILQQDTTQAELAKAKQDIIKKHPGISLASESSSSQGGSSNGGSGSSGSNGGNGSNGSNGSNASNGSNGSNGSNASNGSNYGGNGGGYGGGYSPNFVPPVSVVIDSGANVASAAPDASDAPVTTQASAATDTGDAPADNDQATAGQPAITHLTIIGHVLRKLDDGSFLFTDGSPTNQWELQTDQNLPLMTKIVIVGDPGDNSSINLKHWFYITDKAPTE